MRRSDHGLVVRLRAALVAGALVFAAAAPRAAQGQTCPGDCGQDGGIELGDVALSFKVYLGTAEFEVCSAADDNRDGEVSLGEVQAVFTAFLDSCGS